VGVCEGEGGVVGQLVDRPIPFATDHAEVATAKDRPFPHVFGSLLWLANTSRPDSLTPPPFFLVVAKISLTDKLRRTFCVTSEENPISL
jgi:hypothetical protein